MPKADYSRAGSLKEAIEICRGSLRNDGREEYVPLLMEERVRAAIRVTLESYRHQLEKKVMTYGEDYPWVRDKYVEKQIRHFEDVVRPVYLRIADDGSWPPGASFDYYLFRVDDNNLRYEGLSLHLHLDTPGTMFHGFAATIITLNYGSYIPASEDEDS